jgi:hypothetical protein
MLATAGIKSILPMVKVIGVLVLVGVFIFLGWKVISLEKDNSKLEADLKVEIEAKVSAETKLLTLQAVQEVTDEVEETTTVKQDEVKQEATTIVIETIKEVERIIKVKPNESHIVDTTRVVLNSMWESYCRTAPNQTTCTQ